MSELKAISSGEIYNKIEYEGSCITDDLYYPKSEADKVIEKKDKEICRLKRALYKACANWAHIAVAFSISYVVKNRWRWMELKCLKKSR